MRSPLNLTESAWSPVEGILSWMYIEHGKKIPFSSSTQHTGGGGVVTAANFGAYDNSNKGAANVLGMCIDSLMILRR